MRTSLLFLALLLPAVAHAQAPPLTLSSPNPEAFGFFGSPVSGVPDADGDGVPDLLVGAGGEDGGAMDAGRAYLFSGATGALLRTLTSLNPQDYNSYFGSALSGVADANGDGRGDLLIGAFTEAGGVERSGRAYLFSGATGALLRVYASPNPELDGRFGNMVTSVPDVNGDGRDDHLIGAYAESEGAEHDGRAYLFSGRTGALLRTLESPNPKDFGFFGRAVSGVPDADGDGRGDLLIGAYEDSGAFNSGRAYLFSGATGAVLRTLESPNPEYTGYFGNQVSGVPDANGDGRGDLLVAAPGENGLGPGRAYVFSGATGMLLSTLTSPNCQQSCGFGVSVSGVPDTDGDGRGDLLVGASGESGGAEEDGQAHLFSGATSVLLRTLTSSNPEDFGRFGNAVSGVSDADGDGRVGLLVGASGEDAGAPNAGRAYLFLSGTGLILTASGSTTVIAPRGSGTVTTTATNTTNQPAPLDLWIVATSDVDPMLNGIVFVGSGTLAAGQTDTVSFVLTAPRRTPPGAYTLTVNAGTFLDTVLASDAFDFTVTGERISGTPGAEPFAVASVSGDVFASGACDASSATGSPSVVASPNPFAGQTTLRFALTEASTIRLSVHDVLGRAIAVLLDREAAAGVHTAVFDGRGLASGVYVWRLDARGGVRTGRLTLLE